MPNTYPSRRMTPDEFRDALGTLDLTVGQFMFLTGVSRLTAKVWLRGTDPNMQTRPVILPSWLPGYLAALSVPPALLAAGEEMFARSEYETDHLRILRKRIKEGVS